VRPKKKGHIFHIARMRPSSFMITQGAPREGGLAYTPKKYFFYYYYFYYYLFLSLLLICFSLHRLVWVSVQFIKTIFCYYCVCIIGWCLSSILLTTFNLDILLFLYCFTDINVQTILL